MKKLLCFQLLLMMAAFAAQAGDKKNSCAEARQHRYRNLSAKAAIASPLLDMYDVKYVKLDIRLSHLNNDVSGSGTTTAVVTAAAGLPKYAFELSSVLVVDSVKVNGLTVPFASISADVYETVPGAALPFGAAFTAQVFYHGTGQNGTGFFTHGLNHNVLPTGTNITFTLSDPYLAKDWWPCKQSLTDKIDSADLWFTVPAGTMAGSNGRLQRTTPVGATATRYEWKTKYPIEYYLISASVSPYADHSQMLHFSGSADSMPVQHFVYDTATFYPLYKSAIDSTPLMVDYLSTLYGRYPFWQEKYGHCTAPLGGGMEHQTMTTLGAYTTPLIAHELGHQWWGDCVTYTSWRDIWMSEGWASYTEQLFVEHFKGVAAARAYRTDVFNRVMSRINGAVYVDDTTNVYRIFDSRLTYDKGAAVAHMLRYIAPGDAAFFSGLRAYQQQYAFRNATTADFQAVMETAYGRRLDTFFNQWIYGEGYPTYAPVYNQRGDDVFVRLDQIASRPASVAAFAMPVALLLQSATGDTLVKVQLSTASAQYHFKWSRIITDIVVDPDNEILNRANPAEYDPALSAATVKPERLSIYPNPAGDSWQVSGILPGASLRLLDAAGRVVWQQDHAPAALSISGAALPAGMYTLILQGASSGHVTRKLQKR